uniref:Homeobox protein CDX-1 n=1 Tax=Sphaerodactylus townsendi TaxID=933632 RepID=A0ACB8EJ27_9SAUR
MMYVGYLLDKDTNMYPNSVRHPSLNISPQNYVPVPPQYSDFAGYHHVPGINSDPHHGQSAGAWGSPYAPAKEDWHAYGAGAPSSVASPGQFGYSPPDFNPIQPPGSGLLPPSISGSVPQLSPSAQRRTPFEWMRRNVPTSSNSAASELPGIFVLGGQQTVKNSSSVGEGMKKLHAHTQPKKPVHS